MNNTRKLKVEDVVDNIKLDPKKSDHTDWDVLVAVGEHLRLRFDAEKLNKFTSKATNDDNAGGGYHLQITNQGVKRKTPMNELSYHSSSKKIVTTSEVDNFSKKHPRSSTSVNDDDPLAVVNAFKNDNIGNPKKARESGGLFGTKKAPDEADYNNSFLICESYVRQPASTLDISKLEKRMKMESEKVLFKKSILKSEYPEGMSTEELVLRRERLLKKPIIFNDQEENGQKDDVIQKRRRCTKGSFEKDYYLSDSEEEWGEYNSKKKKKKKSTGRCTSKKGGKNENVSRNRMKVEVSYPPPNLPIEFVKKILEMGGTDIRFVIQKGLSTTDCSKDENRLFISIRTAANFLEESEKKYLQSGIGTRGPKPFINVVLLQPNLEKTAISLRQWNLYKESGKVSGQYVLTKPWFDVVTSNGLAKDVIIQIWSFRVDGKLGLAIVKPEDQELADVGKNMRTGGSEGTSTSSGGATKKSSSSSPPPLPSLDNVH